MENSPVCIHGLQKTYQMGKEIVRALAGVDLEIEKNSFMAVIGPSGSGKSTLLHLIGGLDRPSEGSVQINGRKLEDLDENALAIYRRRNIGFVFQSFNLIPSMNALENVAFPLRFDSVARRERENRSLIQLEHVGLGDRLYHRPGELSGGQQQRAAIARALINNPELILADEPTGNLDTQSSLQILKLLSDLHAAGRTVVVVSHDPRVTSFATHITCLLDGRAVEMEEYNAALALATTEVDPS
jgi:putative ABC transport system ATP-binding protein